MPLQGVAEIWANNLVTQEPALGCPLGSAPGGAGLGVQTPPWGPQELHFLSHLLLPTAARKLLSPTLGGSTHQALISYNKFISKITFLLRAGWEQPEEWALTWGWEWRCHSSRPGWCPKLRAAAEEGLGRRVGEGPALGWAGRCGQLGVRQVPAA